MRDFKEVEHGLIVRLLEFWGIPLSVFPRKRFLYYSKREIVLVSEELFRFTSEVESEFDRLTDRIRSLGLKAFILKGREWVPTLEFLQFCSRYVKSRIALIESETGFRKVLMGLPLEPSEFTLSPELLSGNSLSRSIGWVGVSYPELCDIIGLGKLVGTKLKVYMPSSWRRQLMS